MSTSVVSLAVTDVNESRRARTRTVQVTIAAGDYLTGGLPLDLTTVTNPNNLAEAKFSRNPTSATVKGDYGAYKVKVIPGASLSTWKLKMYDTGTSADSIFNETLQSALNAAGVSTNVILIDFIAPKNL